MDFVRHKAVWLAAAGLLSGVVSVFAASTYYDWSGPAFAADDAGADRSPGGNPDGDRLSNAEEYAFLSDPLAPGASPFRIVASNGAVRLEFPWNRAAADLAWTLEHAASLAAGAWAPVSNAAVQSVPSGAVDDVVVHPGPAYGAGGFFRLNPVVAAPELVLDALDAGLGWLLLSNAQIVDSSSGLLPAAGTGFFSHSVGAN